MADNMFMNREIAFDSCEVPSVMEEQTELEAISRGINNEASERADELPFTILDETVKRFEKFDATGRSLIIKFNSPGKNQDPYMYLKECVTKLTNYFVDEIPGRDVVGMKIRNTENMRDKVVGISFRRCDELNADLVWEK
jgi:hypothetical protein